MKDEPTSGFGRDQPKPAGSSQPEPELCPVCGLAELVENRCKTICRNCRTIVRSCSDL